MLIVADDLTGAADAGAACVLRGLSVVVALGSGLALPDADVLAIDADTRSMNEAAAADEIGRLVAAAPVSRLLFKKVDSTLRGHLGAELKALLEARRRVTGRPATIVLAPAFPATGRTIVGGRPYLFGTPLEQTEVWQNEHGQRAAWLPDMLSAVGLASAIVDLDAVRGPWLGPTLRHERQHANVLICDAASEADLAAIAAAAGDLGVEAILAGSAGLVGHLADAASLIHQVRPPSAPAPPATPLLFVIGSMSSLAREQAAVLEADGDMVRLDVPASSLIGGGQSLQTWLSGLDAALAAGRDAMVLPHGDIAREPEHARRVCDGLAALVGPSAHRIGGLFATGGATARAVLDACGVTSLRLCRELQPGVPLATARGRHRFGVVTKAGAFGGRTTMLDCRRALRDLRGAPAFPSPPLPETEPRP